MTNSLQMHLFQPLSFILIQLQLFEKKYITMNIIQVLRFH